MGRDSSVLMSHPQFEGSAIRAIVTSGTAINNVGGEVAFRLKPEKVHIFDRKAGM